MSANVLQKKYGPLKGWQWGGLVTAAVILGLYMRARNASTAASDQTVNPDQSALDPWTGFPGSGLGAPVVSGDAGAPGTAADTTVPVTMDPPDWWSDPPAWWTAPGAAPNVDNGVASSAGNDGPANGANSATASHRAVTLPKPKATPKSIKATPAAAKKQGAKSGTPQKTTGGGNGPALRDLTGPIKQNDAGEHYETITKDHKVYHYYPGRSGPTKYVYIRKATS